MSECSIPTQWLKDHFYVTDPKGWEISLYSSMKMNYNWELHIWQAVIRVEPHYMWMTKRNLYVPFYHKEKPIILYTKGKT